MAPEHSERTPILSICIPTYNRAEFIGETLESIASQWLPGVEVVISDNASTDNTQAIVESYTQALPGLRYSRASENLGFAANFYRAADLARGKYAWLLGSDDTVCTGQLSRLVEQLGTGAALYIYDRFECHRDLTPIRVDAVLDATTSQRVFEVGSRDALLHYLTHSRSIASLFSFISTVVFDKARWDRIAVEPAWLECAFPHAIRMWGMAQGKCIMEYVPEPLVNARLDNDTFNPDGLRSIPRLLMNYHGYQMIRDRYWTGDSVIQEAFNRIMRRTHPRAGLMKLRRIVSAAEVDEMSRCLADYGYGWIFSSFYGTALCGWMVSRLKRLFVQLGLSPASV